MSRSPEPEPEPERTTTVCFSLARVRHDAPSLATLANAYAAALEVVRGAPVPRDTKPKGVDESDWSDYEYPVHRYVCRWKHGLHVTFDGLMRVPGRLVGTLGFWAAEDDAGLHLQGVTKVNATWQSSAELRLTGEPATVERAFAAFRAALADVDVLGEPDGVAVQALEDVLTQVCLYNEPRDERQARKLVPAVTAVPAGRPAGASARLLLACLGLAEGDAAAARPLLDELVARGPALALSHQVVCGREPDGRLALIAWQDELPEHGAYWEAVSARALVAELDGDRHGAVARYRAVRDAGITLTSEQAAVQLARLGEA